MSMAVPLIVLAIGSIAAGYVGVPPALGGGNRIEHFLEPSFEAHGAPAHETTAASAAAGGVVPAALDSPQEPAPHAGAQAADHAAEIALERLLMAVSSGIALAGIGIAMYFWLRNPNAAAAMARRFRGAHRVLSNKYYVDELYDAAIVQPIKQLSIRGLWRGVDVGVIDGMVNGVGGGVQAASGVLRRAQTGSIRTYAAALFLGAVLILGYYLWP
jgi:NADH-quinone oxidoreductase subunit L